MIGVAIMGAGRMAKVHAASIIAAGAHIVMIYDPVEEMAVEFAARMGARIAASPSDAMADPAVDAIMIAASSDRHVELLYEAVRTGKPVLCEKPLASSYEASREFIIRVGEEAARKVFLGFNRRFD